MKKQEPPFSIMQHRTLVVSCSLKSLCATCWMASLHLAAGLWKPLSPNITHWLEAHMDERVLVFPLRRV